MNNIKQLHGELTYREVQVLNYLAMGLTTIQIGRQLCLGTETIKTYRSNLLAKLQCKNAFQLGARAEKFGYLNKENVAWF